MSEDLLPTAEEPPGDPPVPPPLPVAPAPAVLPAGFMTRTWPGPAVFGGLTVPLAVLVGAVGFAVFVPLNRVGIGWVLGGAAAAAAVATVAVRAHAPVSRSDRIWRGAWGLSALALLSVLAFRNAWWLVTFCVLGALGCATLAAVGGRVIRSILFSLTAMPLAVLRSLPWVASHIGAQRAAKVPAGTPAPGDGATREGTATPQGIAAPQGARFGRGVRSVIVTAALLLVFGALLTSADAAFATVLSSLVPTIDGGVVFRWIFLFCAGAAATSGAAYLVSAPPNLSGMEKPGVGRLHRTEWALPIGALGVLFAGFVAVQVTVLFGGRAHVLQTAGLTYAEYARSGFWQLTTVTVLTLLVVAGTARWAIRTSRTDRVVLRTLLGALSTLSLVIVASALYRMYTYQQVYSFTGERIFVMAFELLLGTVFVMIIIAGIQLSGAWVPRAMVAGAVVMLLSLAILNPELYAARRNVQRYEASQKIDLWYLRALSADATPALAELPDELRRCTLMWISGKLSGEDPWYGWNLGREQARRVLRDLGPGAVGDCSKAGQWDYLNTQ